MIMKSKQVVLITGSSTGFGRLFTETLARKGHTVFATMRDPGGRNAKNASEIRTLAEKDSHPSQGRKSAVNPFPQAYGFRRHSWHCGLRGHASSRKRCALYEPGLRRRVCRSRCWSR